MGAQNSVPTAAVKKQKSFAAIGFLMEKLCIPLDGNKMAIRKSLFWASYSTTLEQWGLDKWDTAEVTFAYLNIISANFKQDP